MFCGLQHLKRAASDISIPICFIYHVIRVGPYVMSFAYVYTLCHKEGHATAAKTGLFAKPFDHQGSLRHIFNWWVGLFYGVIPSSFAIGHSINHHKYNNGPNDVVSTTDTPRDSVMAWVCYIPRFARYSSNISTTRQFITEGKHDVALRIIYGSLWYVAFFGLVAQMFGLKFAVAYLCYPFLENVLLLATVNWSWHAFVDPNDHTNEYVSAITLVNGPINVLNEDAHVVHHQYPGVHWTRHPELLKKHSDRYASSLASVFYGTHTFELVGFILTKNYDKLADRFVGYLPSDGPGSVLGGDYNKTNHKMASLAGKSPECPVPHAERVKILKARLRECQWGPRYCAPKESRTNGEHED